MLKRRIVIGISGASGAPIAVAVLQALRDAPDVETHLVVTESGRKTISLETDLTLEEVKELADHSHDNQDIGAPIASGSFKTLGMVIVPCSMKTLAAVHAGYSDNLLQRAADVTLKEARPLVLVPRETPLSAIHLRNMYELSQAGVRILPPMLSYYNKPETIQDLTDHITGKILDVFDIQFSRFRRWGG